MKDLLTWLVTQMVDDEDAVEVEEQIEGDEHVLHLQVSRADRGIVIGRQGRTARALEIVLQAAARDRRRAVLEIAD